MKKNKFRYALNKITYDPKWIVLDIGSGHNPISRADILIDSAVHEIDSRIAVPQGSSLIIADAQKIPLKNKCIDFVVANHIAEHVEDPALFCNELMRVAKEGYIETPGIIADIFLNEPYHPWRVYSYNKMLIFKRKRNFKSLIPFFYQLFYYGENRLDQVTFRSNNPMIHYPFLILRYAIILFWMWTPFRITSYRWKGEIHYRVIDKLAGKS